MKINGTHKNKALDELFNTRRILRTMKDEHSAKELDKVNTNLSEMCSEENYKVIKEACEGATCEEGGMPSGKLCQLKKKLGGIIAEPPTAMLDEHGNLIKSNNAIEELTIKMYEDRLKSLKIREELRMHKLQRESTCDKRLKEAQENITPDWSMEDLNLVLKQLKNNKSRDPLGWANELFKPNKAGYDLKMAILRMMNQI